MSQGQGGPFCLETPSGAKALKGGDLLKSDKDITWKHLGKGRQKGWRERGKCPPRPPRPPGPIRAAAPVGQGLGPGPGCAGLPPRSLFPQTQGSERCAPGLLLTNTGRVHVRQ